MSALIIGVGGGMLCSIACSLKPKFGYDDSLDVVGVHGVGGTWGALATGLFASKAVNAAGNDGLFFGNPGQLWTQFVSCRGNHRIRHGRYGNYSSDPKSDHGPARRRR